MRFANEIVIMVIEILGMLLVSAGLGAIAQWWFGIPGLLLAVSGVCLLAFATLAAFRQRSINSPPTPPGR